MSPGERIIPARAGFTGRRHDHVVAVTDHPRSRGVYCYAAGLILAMTGSSPLARGLLLVAQVDDEAGGIIPARAGFTPEQVSYGGQAAGSSPLARGLRLRTAMERHAPGIIPARAGFTPGRHDALHRAPDHPRSRGVYAVFLMPSR